MLDLFDQRLPARGQQVEPVAVLDAAARAVRDPVGHTARDRAVLDTAKINRPPVADLFLSHRRDGDPASDMWSWR